MTSSYFCAQLYTQIHRFRTAQRDHNLQDDIVMLIHHKQSLISQAKDLFLIDDTTDLKMILNLSISLIHIIKFPEFIV